MELTAVSCENYKAFKRRQQLEMRPLTVLIGKNSSGKSAIARLPLLIGRALSKRSTSAIDLEFDGLDFGRSFKDVVHNRISHGRAGLGATFSDASGRTVQLWCWIQNFDEYRLQVVTEWELTSSDGFQVKLEWAGTDPLEEASNYRASGLYSGPVEVRFQGLLPDQISFPNGENAATASVRSSLHTIEGDMAPALERLDYLGAFRRQPERSYRYAGGMPKGVGIVGAQAPQVLAAAHAQQRQYGAFLESIKEWYRANLGWQLSVSPAGEGFELVLHSPDDPTVTINLVDAGHGMSQVLPLLVQRKFEELGGEGAAIEVVEQPELHLHPAAHGALADLYVLAALRPRTRLIVETHSESFVLRVRRWVADGRLPPDRVLLYWVDDEQRPGSQLTPIHITRGGEVDYWPTGVFSEDFEEVRQIREAQRKAPTGEA
jgi:hypothetical protein